MYHIDADLSDKKSKKEESLVNEYGQKFAQFKISFCTRLKFNYFSMCKICCYSKRDKKLKKVMKKAEKQIYKALDTRRIIRNQRALKTLLRLTLSKPAKKLIHMQRRSNVIELSESLNQSELSSSSSENDFKINKVTKRLNKLK